MYNNKYITDPDAAKIYHSYIVPKESNGNYSAKNPTSSAFGVGQLIRSNVDHYAKKLGIDPKSYYTDPDAQDRITAAMVDDQAKQIRAKGLPVNNVTFGNTWHYGISHASDSSDPYPGNNNNNNNKSIQSPDIKPDIKPEIKSKAAEEPFDYYSSGFGDEAGYQQINSPSEDNSEDDSDYYSRIAKNNNYTKNNIGSLFDDTDS